MDQLNYLNKLTLMGNLNIQLKSIIKKIDETKDNEELNIEEKKRLLIKFKKQISLISQQVDKLKKEINLTLQYKIN